jgi:hypothetical protein
MYCSSNAGGRRHVIGPNLQSLHLEFIRINDVRVTALSQWALQWPYMESLCPSESLTGKFPALYPRLVMLT